MSSDDQPEGPHMVQCVKFGKLMEGLQKPPLKGERNGAGEAVPPRNC